MKLGRILAFLWLVLAGPVMAQTADLFISEYVEGSGNNKALEFYNGTESLLNLGDYVLERYSNGTLTPFPISLPAVTLPHGETFVMVYTQADATLLAYADQTDANLNFNGNDALVLRRGAVVVDSIGQVGFDPVTGWTCASGSTLNTTMRRLSAVCAGDTDPFNPYNPCAGFGFFPSDAFDGLGDHFADCSSVAVERADWTRVKALYR